MRRLFPVGFPVHRNGETRTQSHRHSINWRCQRMESRLPECLEIETANPRNERATKQEALYQHINSQIFGWPQNRIFKRD